MLVYFMFELSQARLELERDGRQRIYFRERSGDFNHDREQLHQRIISWLYGEFLRQIFGQRDKVSCVHFLEKISCKFHKNRDPNKICVDETIVPEKSWRRNKKDGINDSVAEIDAQEIMVPLFQLGLTLNDWFDPIFIQQRIERLKKSNKLDSEDGDR